MDRVRALSMLCLAGLLAACGPTKSPPSELLGRPVTDWSPEWLSAAVSTEAELSEAQRKSLRLLEPAGGEGRVGLGFTEDFDHDGRTEAVAWGRYAKVKEEGNFVLVTRKEAGRTTVLLLQELPGQPQFTVFTLKPDGSLWFGGGIDAGEVTMSITWNDGKPAFHHLTGE